jgi:hypothetical protein
MARLQITKRQAVALLEAIDMWLEAYDNCTGNNSVAGLYRSIKNAKKKLLTIKGRQGDKL